MKFITIFIDKKHIINLQKLQKAELNLLYSDCNCKRFNANTLLCDLLQSGSSYYCIQFTVL